MHVDIGEKVRMWECVSGCMTVSVGV
jgi:hypothetical protein